MGERGGDQADQDRDGHVHDRLNRAAHAQKLEGLKAERGERRVAAAHPDHQELRQFRAQGVAGGGEAGEPTDQGGNR